MGDGHGGDGSKVGGRVSTARVQLRSENQKMIFKEKALWIRTQLTESSILSTKSPSVTPVVVERRLWGVNWVG